MSGKFNKIVFAFNRGAKQKVIEVDNNAHLKKSLLVDANIILLRLLHRRLSSKCTHKNF